MYMNLTQYNQRVENLKIVLKSNTTSTQADKKCKKKKKW